MHLVGCLGFDNVLPTAAIPLRVPDRPVFFFNPLKNVRCIHAPAAVWKNCVSESELRQCDFAAAKQCRRISTKAGTNSRRSTKLQNLIEARFHSDPDGGAVL